MRYHYPASRKPVEVLQAGSGSCSGKHYLLGALYEHIGVSVRHVLCTHRFNESPLPFPDSIQALLNKDEIVDVHNYLQIHVDGDWLDVDATWELWLREFGFPVTEDWDGKTSMLLTVVPDEHIPVEGDPVKAKEELLSHLTPRQRGLRTRFLEALAGWVEELAAEEPDS